MSHHHAAFIRMIDSKSTQRSLLRSQLEIFSGPDTDPFECTSSDVQKAYPPQDLYSLYVLQ